MPFAISSSVFEHNAPIPRRYTCDGQDLSPPLVWSGTPEQTRSLVLIVDDPDAPDPAAPKLTWVHWLLYDLPADSHGLLEAISPADLPIGTRQGHTNWDRTGYGGPCPPVGRHRYFFKLYALGTVLLDLGRVYKPALLKAMQGHVLASTELIGTYQH